MSEPIFTPADWYWFVAGDEARAYSSNTGEYVQVSDAAFQAWREAGNAPTRIASEAELGEVLAQYSLRPLHVGVLDGYKDSQASQISIKVAAKILFWLVNEVRALKGQQPITAVTFRNFVKGLM
jgi:hypothetical protein